ncbi:MAG: SDR family oxidoreductase [Ignavibacteria bacterium]
MKKICLITGASKGIGKSCAKLFLDNNYVVINASRTNKYPLSNENYHFIKTDVAKEADIIKLFDTVIKKFKQVDVLICNAGFATFALLVDSKTKDFDEMFAVNVKGLYLCNRYGLKSMIKKKSGTIINMSSVGGKNGFPSASIYCATKHAVMGFSAALMAEVRKDNIRVITVCPGSVDTNFFDHPSAGKSAKRETLLSPDDVAKICFLSAELPDRAMINEIEIRPLNPQN